MATEEDVEVTASVVRVDGQLCMVLGGAKPNSVQIVPINERSLPEYTIVNGHLTPMFAPPPAG